MNVKFRRSVNFILAIVLCAVVVSFGVQAGDGLPAMHEGAVHQLLARWDGESEPWNRGAKLGWSRDRHGDSDSDSDSDSDDHADNDCECDPDGGDGGGGSNVPPGCPAEYALRDTTTVINDLYIALEAQNWELVACHYAVDAFVIDDQGILVGHADIIAAAQSLATLFNGVSPTINAQDVFQDTARVLFRLDAGWVVIPDGVHSYVVEGGVITRQTSHGFIEFTGPPPGQT